MTPPNLSAQNRTRLFYLVRDLLDKSHSDGFVRDESPSGLAVLDELLRRRLGRLQLVPGKNLPDSIAEFVQTASETELLDLIESVPRARLKTGGALRGAPREDAEKTMSRLDRFMEFVGVSARFRSTGTLNRDAFETPEKKSLSKLQKKEELSQDLKSLLSRTEPTAVILFDLDGFKAVNERNGYEAGDKCLQATVDAVVKCILHKGKIYRFREGDEFAIVLRNTIQSEAAATAERIRKAIEDRSPGGELRVTASLGVASSSQAGLNSAKILLSAVEDALHVSKHTKKNCVTSWPIPK